MRFTCFRGKACLELLDRPCFYLFLYAIKMILQQLQQVFVLQ